MSKADNPPSVAKADQPAPTAPTAPTPERVCAPPRGNSGHSIDELLNQLVERLGLEASTEAVEPPAGYRPDAKGRLVPDCLIRPADAIEDETVRRILAFGVDLADQIARFRRHTYADVAALLDLLAESYGATHKPGRKGNVSLTSYDGRAKVVVQVQDRIAFGPELQAARVLVDECITEWSKGARPEVVRLLQDAFQPDREGQISREAVFRLRRIDIDDPRWKGVQAAIGDAVRVVGTRTYLRLYIRGAVDGPWRAVPIDIAASWTDTDQLAQATTP